MTVKGALDNRLWQEIITRVRSADLGGRWTEENGVEPSVGVLLGRGIRRQIATPGSASMATTSWRLRRRLPCAIKARRLMAIDCQAERHSPRLPAEASSLAG
jgi:hypothetical protein